MKALLNDFIKIIKQQTPPEVNSVDMLIDIIPMSKEAAYRRLRGEIDFSFDEVVKIARRLNVSLDDLIGLTEQGGKSKIPMIDLGGDLVDGYCRSLKEFIATMEILNSSSNPVVSISSNVLLPFHLVHNYETLSKFRIFRWNYQWGKGAVQKAMKDISLPHEVLKMESSLFKATLGMDCNYICRPELLRTYVDDVNYFQKINLLSDAEVLKIKEEVYCLLSKLESDAVRGENQNGVPFNLYVCNTNFDVTYLLFSCDDFANVSAHLFGIAFFFFEDQNLVDKVRNWQNSLITNSTLISVYNERSRIEFFQYQRKLVGTLGAIHK